MPTSALLRFVLIALVSLMVAWTASPTPDFLTVSLLWGLVLLLGLAGGWAASWLRKNSGNGR